MTLRIERRCGKWPNKRGEGGGIKWLRAHVGHEGDDCLIWPWGNRRGYAVVSVNGKQPFATRVMCELRYGPPPTPSHESAHSCGRGHLGCVNPNHLSWKTRSDNQRDRRRHGTHGKGRWNHVKFKLTPEKVAQIRAIGSSKSKQEIGIIFGITPSNVAKILKYQSWRTPGQYPKGGFTSETSRAANLARARPVVGEAADRQCDHYGISGYCMRCGDPLPGTDT